MFAAVVRDEGGKATPAINCSEPLDLQDLTPNPAAEPQTPQWSRETAVRGSEPRKRAIFLVENFFIAVYSLTNQNSYKISMQFDPAHI